MNDNTIRLLKNIKGLISPVSNNSNATLIDETLPYTTLYTILNIKYLYSKLSIQKILLIRLLFFKDRIELHPQTFKDDDK